jgi:indole-3-glycerol phosphate synthase
VETYLSGIIAAHTAHHAANPRDLDEAVRHAEAGPAPRGFRAALERASAEGLALIAEVKRRSPSLGALVESLDPAALARAYAAGGAACCSVLTDAAFFGGSPADLAMVRRTVDLPILRKDFTVDPLDVADARAMGADAVLLIAAVLSDAALVQCLELARHLELDALVEVHDERELDRALAVGADLIGVNQRDLVTFAVDQERAVRLAASMPPSVFAVAESGIRGPQDAAALAEAGFSAILVGELLVKSADPEALASTLIGYDIRRGAA